MQKLDGFLFYTYLVAGLVFGGTYIYSLITNGDASNFDGLFSVALIFAAFMAKRRQKKWANGEIKIK